MSSHAETIVHVSGPRPTLREVVSEIGVVVATIPLFTVSPLLRGWHRRWGSSDAEVTGAMPGDALVPGCQYQATRAITIDAPPEVVWPWLLQVGFGRAGFYSHDLLDNAAHPSARRIIPELQHLAVGDWIPMFRTVNETTAFKVASLEPARSMVWAKPDSTWAWTLAPDLDRTRLVTRLRILYRWDRPAEAVMSLLLNELGDFPMMRRMLLTLKARAEGARPNRR